MRNLPCVPLLTLAMLVAVSAPAQAAGRVDLLIVTEQGVSPTAQQDWLRRLSGAGVQNLQIRSARVNDEMGIQSRGTASSPSYAVTAILRSSGDLHVPGARFSSSGVSRLVAWLNELAELGPADQRPEEAAFGMDVKQFEAIHDDLARPLGFSTKEKSRSDVIRTIGRGLRYPLLMDPALLQAMEGELLSEELSGLTSGTALAYVASMMNLRLIPRVTTDGKLQYAVTPAGGESWPVGWEIEKKPHEVLPAMNESQEVNIPGVPLLRVLEVISGLLEVPILLDHASIARQGIEPEKILSEYPAKKTTCSMLLRRILFTARLKSEIRLDEADHPFVWVTTIKR